MTRKCKICGRNFQPNNFEEAQYYCSFSCSLIDKRKKFFIMSIIFLLIAIILQIINYFIVQEIELEIIFILFYIGFGFFLIFAVWGYILHSKRKRNSHKSDVEESNFHIV